MYLTLWAVICDEGRNITYFEAVLQSCKLLHSDIYQTQCCEQHQTLLLKEVSLPQSMGGPGASLQTAWGYPARSWINPDPFLSPHLEHGWKLKTVFFPERKFCFNPSRALSTWSQGLHLLFLTGPYSQNYIFLHFKELQEHGSKHIKFTMMQSYQVKSYSLLLCYIFMK